MIFHKRKSHDAILLRELYERYRGLLYNVAFGILKNETYSEDAVHNTIVRVSNHLDKIRSFSNDNETRNYISAICRNAAIDIYNVNKKMVLSDEVVSNIPGTLVLPEDYVVDKESYNELVEVFNSLNSNNIIALKLYRIYHHTVEEIAEIMDISVENAYKRVQRGRKELSEKLEERKCKDSV